jgi:hypothetical protein
MKIKGNTQKAFFALGVSGALVLCGTSAAQAVTTQTNFSTIVPRLQQSYYWEYQNKTTSYTSQVYFSAIGASYLMNVKAQNGATGVQYSEKKSIAEGSSVYVPNGTPVSTGTRLIVTNDTWALVDVQATGWFKTN